MTSLQSIVSRRQKTQSSTESPAGPAQVEVRKIDVSGRVEWLQKLYTTESKETLRNFAMGFETEGDMQTRALNLKREGRDLKPEVADWNYVESRHQTLKSKSKKPQEERVTIEEQKQEVPVTTPPPPASRFYERRSRRGSRRGFQGRGRYARGGYRNFHQDIPVVESVEETTEVRKEEEVAAGVSEPVVEPEKPQVKETPVVVETPPVHEERKETEVSHEQAAAPAPQPVPRQFPKPRPATTGARKWVKKTVPAATPAAESVAIESKPPAELHTTSQQSFKPLVKPEEAASHVEEVSLKEAEAKAHKMTLDLVDHSDESSEQTHLKNAATQTESRFGLSSETQTDAELIWRSGIPCMLVPLSGVPGYTMQVGVLGNPGKLFGS